MIARRRFLTLLEILIVIAILVFITGVIGFNVRRALITQRFSTEAAMLADTIRLAQDMMLILSRDVLVKIEPSKDGSGIQYYIEVEGGTPKNWERTMARSRRTLDSTHYINFMKKDDFPAAQGTIHLRFQSKGATMSRGELQVSTHEDPYSVFAIRRAICLRGYPHPLKSVPVAKTPSRGEVWSECSEEAEREDFFKQLTLYTRDEVFADTPPKKTSGSKKKKQEQETEGENESSNAKTVPQA